MRAGGMANENASVRTRRLPSSSACGESWSPEGRKKIQAIDRREMGRYYNASPCDSERKAAGAGTVDNRKKTMRYPTKTTRPPPRGAGRTHPRLGFQP